MKKEEDVRFHDFNYNPMGRFRKGISTSPVNDFSLIKSFVFFLHEKGKTNALKIHISQCQAWFYSKYMYVLKLINGEYRHKIILALFYS